MSHVPTVWGFNPCFCGILPEKLGILPILRHIRVSILVFVEYYLRIVTIVLHEKYINGVSILVFVEYYLRIVAF